MKFSLVIPLAPERDAEIIGSLKELNYPKSDFHIIVVKGRNPSENRNKGFVKSKGALIGFLDDDAIVDKELLNNAEKFFRENPRIDIVGGPQLTPPSDKGFAKISGYALASKFGAWKLAGRYTKKEANLEAGEKDLTSANLFCRRKVLEKVKFDPRLFPGEDPDFIDQAKKEGFKVAYSPELVLYHRRRASLKAMIKQIFNYGKVRPAKESIKTTIKTPFFLAPSLFTAYLFLALILTVLNFMGIFILGKMYIWMLLPLFLYLTLDLTFSVYESFRNKNIGGILLSFIYPVIHISYGLGMIYGYAKGKKGKKLKFLTF